MIRLDHMVWQPIVDLQTMTLIGYEALARFRDGVQPADAFHQAGDNAVMLDHLCLDWVWRHPPTSGKIFVNVSPAFVRTGAWLWPPYRLRARVVWELPEVSGWHPADIPAWLTVALDDIGAGHAELQRLASVRWQFLKLDQALTQQVTTSSVLAGLVRQLVREARQRGGSVIAEGIETASVAAAIQNLGVRYGQGYWLGRPQRRPQQIKEA